MPVKRLRLAELAAGLSAVTDLAAGLPDGQGVRSTVLAMAVGDRLGLAEDDRTTLFWLGLLRLSGWTARSVETAEVLGSARPEVLAPVDAGRPRLIGRSVGRFGRRGASEASTGAWVDDAAVEHAVAAHRAAAAEVGQVIAARFGVPPRVVAAVGQVFAAWDGWDVDVAVRVWQVAHRVDRAFGAGGRSAVRALLRQDDGRQLDPDVGKAVLGGLRELPFGSGGLAALLASEPPTHRLIDQSEVDAILPVFGLVADFMAPFLGGHSERVAQLAADAAVAAGLGPHDVTLVRRAGWVHDVGRVAVPSGVWIAAPPLSDEQLGELHRHPEFTVRALQSTPGLSALAAVAGAHHERLDGSGYPRGSRGAEALPLPAALLAAADAYVSAGEERPHRPARPPAEQAFTILGLARDGRLPHAAVDAVIAAVNARPPRR